MEKSLKAIREKRYKTYKKSVGLQRFTFADDTTDTFKVKKQQNEKYKEFQFYDNLLKSMSKIK